MSKGHAIEVNVTPASNGTTVKVDGVEIRDGLVAVTVHAKSGAVSTVALEFIARSVKITGAVDGVESAPCK